jgi:hypothetical protein
MPEPIVESGMEFISDNSYHLEKSQAFASVNDGKSGIKSVEFIRKKNDMLLFVEAKTTFPHPESAETPERFDEEIGDICDKFIHSLNLYSSIKIGVTENYLPDVFDSLEKISLMLVLVVRNHKDVWCKPIKSGLEQRLPYYFRKIWKPTVLVLNFGLAKEFHLID